MEARSVGRNLFFSLLVGGAGFVSAAFYALSDRIALSGGHSAHAAGYYVAVYAAGSLGSTLLWGRLSQRMGKRRAVGVNLLCLMLGMLLLFLSPAAPVILAGLLLLGMGVSATETLSSAILTDSNPRSATRWMNLSQICFCLGALLAPVAAVWYSRGLDRSHREFFLILAVFLVPGLLLLPRVDSPPAAAAASEEAVPAFAPWKNSSFLRLAWMVFLYIGCESIFSTNIKLFFRGKGSGELAAAGALSLFWLCMILGRLAGVLLDFSGREAGSLLVFGCILLSGLGLLLWAPAPPLRFLGTALSGFGCGPIWCILFVLGGREYPENTAAAFFMLALFSTAANILFPLICGVLEENVPVSFGLGALLAGCLLLLSTVYAKKKKPSPG